jgi:hypothetical protein
VLFIVKYGERYGLETAAGEEVTKVAQKMGQLQPFTCIYYFIDAFPQECVGQLASFGPT